MAKSFPIRVAIYSIVLLWIAGDLFVFDGPLRRRIDRQRPDSPEAVARARAQGVVARVFQHPITRGQLDRAMTERLALEGRRLEDLEPAERKILTYAVLGTLIDHQLLRVKAKAHANEIPVSEAEVDAAWAEFRARFPADADLPALLASQGVDSEKEMRFRLAATLQQTKYLEARIAEAVAVGDDEARAWYEGHPELSGMPYAEAKPAIVAALEADRREQAVASYRRNLREQEAVRIQVDVEALFEGGS